MIASAIAAGLLGAGADLAELLAVGVGLDVGRQPAVGQLAADAQHARAVGREPDRRRRVLVERKPEDRVLEVEEVAGEVHGGALGLPQHADHPDRLLEAADGLVELHAVGLDVHALARAEAEDRAPAGEMGGGERLLGELRGVAADRVGHAHADLDALGGRAGGAHHHQRVEVLMRVRLVLRERGQVVGPHRVRRPTHQVAGPPDRIEAVRLGLLRELHSLRGRRHDPPGGAQCDSHRFHGWRV